MDVYNNNPYYSPYSPYGYYNSWYPGWQQGTVFYTGRLFRSRTIVRSSHFVARGGFGKLGGVSAAT